ncbi:MAG: signal recognition particle protein [Acidobacteria bacterium]|jgi:signal recognition particle subunit SRP54|nr:signal recognition particle protein [Acidobacteriota bacterium]
MLESLSTRLQDVFKSLRGEARLTEASVDAALREIRLALLEADVNFRVVKAFIDRVRAKAVGDAVLRSLSPDQHVVRIVRDEMLALFGDVTGGLVETTRTPRVVLMLGLQGSGKTTTSAKLARWLVQQGKHPLLVSTDVRRPAAIEQLSVLARQVGVRVHDPEGELDPVARASGALVATRQLGFDTLIVDTAGRLHIDDELMAELDAIIGAVEPTDLLYVADAMTGQDAIRSAGEFHARTGAKGSGVTGVVLTKLDGDQRGGAALSVVGVVGVPIAFVGVGERPQDLEPFHADRLVSRMLGMGDVLTLIERAEAALDDESREKLEKKTRLDDFTLEDFSDQLRTITKMGPLDQVLGMIPGLGGMKELNQQRSQVDEKQMGRVQAIIGSMTMEERQNHQVINGSRRKRIARGSGTTVEAVNRVLKQFVEMRKMLKTMSGVGGGRKGKERLTNMLRGK